MIGGRDQHVPSGHTPPRAVFGAAAFEKAPRVNVAPFNPVEMSEVSDAPPKALSDCRRCCMTRPPKFGPFAEQRVLSPPSKRQEMNDNMSEVKNSGYLSGYLPLGMNFVKVRLWFFSPTDLGIAWIGHSTSPTRCPSHLSSDSRSSARRSSPWNSRQRRRRRE
jgi:hypothetical protein